MSTPPASDAQQTPPAPTRVTPVPADADTAHGEDLDPEEDVAPNLGGEDQMQDA